MRFRIKSWAAYGLALGSIGLIASCMSETATAPKPEAQDSLNFASTDTTSPQLRALTPEDEPYISKLLAEDYARKDIQGFGQGYLVEGDIYYTKARLQSELVAARTTQRRTPNALARKNAPHITVSNQGLKDYEWEIRQAVNLLNSANSALRLIYVGETKRGDANKKDNISVIRYDKMKACGYGLPPGKDGSTDGSVQINIPAIAKFSKVGDARKQVMYTIAHEIGHAIGLAHTGTSAGFQIRGTPDQDKASLMNSGECGDHRGFSSADKDAINTLYPNKGSIISISSGYDHGSFVLSNAGVWRARTIATGNFATYLTQFGSKSNFFNFVGDFNGDGLADALSVSPDGTWWGAKNNGNDKMVPGNGAVLENFRQPPEMLALVGDINGDGKDDLVASAGSTSSIWNAAISNGNHFTHVANVAKHYVPVSPQNIFLRDMNGDGRADLVKIPTAVGDYFQVRPSLVAVTAFQDQPNSCAEVAGEDGVFGGVAMGDFNRDGKADALKLGQDNRLYLYLSNGTCFGKGQDVGSIGLGAQTIKYPRLTTGDLNGDGFDDLLVYSQSIKYADIKLWDRKLNRFSPTNRIPAPNSQRMYVSKATWGH